MHEPPVEDLLDLQRRLAGVIADSERLAAESRDAGRRHHELAAQLQAATARLATAEVRFRGAPNVDAELESIHKENARLRSMSPANGRVAWLRVKERIAKAERSLETRTIATEELAAARANFREVVPRVIRGMKFEEAQLLALKDELAPHGLEIGRAERILGSSSGRWGPRRVVAVLILAVVVAEMMGAPVAETILVLLEKIGSVWAFGGDVS